MLCITDVFRKVVLLFAVLVPAVLAIYAVLPSILGFGPSDLWNVYFPPFSQRANSTHHSHLGAEYWYVADSIVRGEGYSSPFGVASGPTAWMPPGLPTILAGIHLAVGKSKSATVAIYVTLNLLVFTWVAWHVARTSMPSIGEPKVLATGDETTSSLSDRKSIPEASVHGSGRGRWIISFFIPISILIVFLANFNDNFQRTHDGTLLLLVMHLIVAFVMVDRDWIGSRWTMICWGLLGGIASLSSPTILLAWLAMSLRYVMMARGCSRLGATGDSEPMALAMIDEDKEWISDSESKPKASSYGSGFGTTIRVAMAVLIAFAIQSPWLIRNYIQFSKFVPIKNNGLFELEQSLLRDDDGVLDYGTSLQHPYIDEKEAAKHADMGEVAYVEQRARTLREKFWERRWAYVEHCSNRIFAMIAWQIPLTPSQERYTWTHIARFLYAIPWIVFLSSLVPNIPLTRAQKNVLLLTFVFLLPYALLSYYSRYMIPLMGVRCLLLIWGIQRWIDFGYAISVASDSP